MLDYSDEAHVLQREVTESTLRDLGAKDIPMIYVYNKADLVMKLEELPEVHGNRIYMSAKTGAGLEELAELIRKYTGGRGNDKRRYF